MADKGNLIVQTMAFTKEDRLLSWYCLLSTLLLMAMAFTFTWISNHVIIKLISGIAAGLITVRLVVIYHDFQHGAILKGSVLAQIIMTTVGLLTLTPPSIWDESHEHHHHTNSKFATFVLGSFPTITTSMYRKLSRKEQFRYKLLRHPLIIALGYIPIFLVSFCLWPFFENPKKYWDCGIAAIVHITLAVALCIYGGWPALLFSLLIPSTLAFSLGGYIFYAQHNFRDVILTNDESWNYFEAALKSSSYIRMTPLMQWFTANIGYHHVHHVNPRIPFYNLPHAMRALTELQHPRCTSLHPKEIWKCLQLKLWDEDLGRMITMQEYR